MAQILGEGLQAFARARPFYPPPFTARFPWYGADLQTIRNSVVDRQQEAPVSDRIKVAIGGAGALSLAVTHPHESSGKALVLIHGLGGSEDSVYMKNTAHFFAAQGWHVYRMNYRGVGPSRATSLPPYSAGLTGDLRAVLRAVEAEETTRDMYALGFSLGGQLLMRTLGEGDVPACLRAGASVSAPLDLAASQRKLERRRNAPYVRYLVENMKSDVAGVEHKSFTRPLSEIRSVLEFDEHIIAPYFGFANAQDYYRCVSCLPVIEKIGVPFLAIHAANDPWIPVEDYHRARWPAGVAAGALITQSGGHVGFHGAGNEVAWYKNTAQKFFAEFR